MERPRAVFARNLAAMTPWTIPPSSVVSFHFAMLERFCQLPILCSGSNGQDYPSECHLRRSACEKRMTNLTVKYTGHCNPCHGFECGDGSKECHVDVKTRKPVCQCDRDCANETSPVCASDGRTVSCRFIYCWQTNPVRHFIFPVSVPQ